MGNPATASGWRGLGTDGWWQGALRALVRPLVRSVGIAEVERQVAEMQHYLGPVPTE